MQGPACYGRCPHDEALAKAPEGTAADLEDAVAAAKAAFPVPPDDSRIVAGEPFGPVLPVLFFDDIDEVVTRANDTRFGLAGSVWGPPEQAAAVALHLGRSCPNRGRFFREVTV